MKEIILDRSKENDVYPGYSIIETDLDFLRSEANLTEKIWVRGNFMCDWVKTVYRIRKINDLKITELISPYQQIRNIIGVELDSLDSDLLRNILKIINTEKVEQLNELLRFLTTKDFWIEDPSVQHAAEWLMMEIDPKLTKLAEQIQLSWSKQVKDTVLKKVYEYSIDRREEYLINWLFEDELKNILGVFPIKLEKKFEHLLYEKIGKRLRSSNGKAVLEFPQDTKNKSIYAKAILEYFSNNVKDFTINYLSHISLLLNTNQRNELQNLLNFSKIEPLSINATHEEAFEWATLSYLPFRDYELSKPTNDQTEADELALSFVNWTLEKYPELTSYPSENSPINIKTRHIAEEFSKTHWVLWVVVDGLNYLDHHKLLKLLGEKANLRISRDETVLAVLPTITKRAKYGLTVGKFAYQEEEIKEQVFKKVFIKAFPDGVYAGDTGFSILESGLQSETPKVCYWNFTEIDKLFHKNVDLRSARHDVDSALEALAKKINDLVNSSYDPKLVAVVVCSDHGQMLRECKKLNVSSKSTHTYTHGRTALGSFDSSDEKLSEDFLISENLETVSLNPKSFRLYEPTTVVYKLGYLAEDKKKTKGGIGFHGGLFPEETVLGLSVLLRNTNLQPITAKVFGQGESGKSGKITITIDNPNSASINLITIIINGIEISEQSELFQSHIPKHQNKQFEFSINIFPEPQLNDEFIISGKLYYEFEDGVTETCDITGKLICRTLYSSKGPNLSSRFKNE